jgi:hypothetical protein
MYKDKNLFIVASTKKLERLCLENILQLSLILLSKAKGVPLVSLFGILSQARDGTKSLAYFVN